MFGPLARFELTRLSRRYRLHRWRCLYALALLGALLLAYSHYLPVDAYPQGPRQGNVVDPREASAFGTNLFAACVAVQFLAVLALTPAAAEAVAEEKNRKRLDFLLVTDLTNREVVLGKFAPRAVYLFSFFLSGVPVLALLPLFGGVDPGVVLASVTAYLCTFAGLLALAAFWSVHARTARNAVGYTYSSLFVYGFLISGASWGLLLWEGVAGWPSTPAWTSPVEIRDAVEVLSAGNPFAAAALVADRVGRGAPLDEVLPVYLGRYVAFYALLTLVCGVTAVWRLRAAAAEQAGGKAGRAGPAADVPTLPPVTDRPVLWREVYCEAFYPRNRLLRRAARFFTLLGLLPIGWMLWEWLRRTDPDLPEFVNMTLRVLGPFVVLGVALGVSNQTLRALGKERARRTFDSLVLTDLTPREILRQKWQGVALSARPAVLWLASVWVTGGVLDAVHWAAIPLLLVATAVYCAFSLSLGLWCSVATRTTREAGARMSNVLLLLSALAGLGALILWLLWGTGPAVYWGLAVAPPFTLVVLPIRAQDVLELWHLHRVQLCAGGLATLAGLAFYAYLAWRFWRAAATRFERDSDVTPDEPGRPPAARAVRASVPTD